PHDTPVVLAGFSLGGYVAIEMLATPQRPLHAAALVSTSARPESAEAAAAREKTIAALRKNVERVVDGIVQFGTHEPSPERAAALKAMMLRVGADTAIRQNRAVMGRGDHRAALARLALPVAVLCGAQDRITPPALSRELADLVPGAQLTLVEGCGHMLPCENAAAVAQAIRALLP
ncbi:MAG: alpha/beta fold hydrolase, partial [Comamonadaceae bacterium]